MEKQSVAVIGAGPSGLTVLKNLREEGFNVKVFEKKSSFGGVWSYSDDAQTTSTLPWTISNVSKFSNSFTDFPIPDDLPPHLTAPQVCDYLKSYARHFDLDRDVELNTSVQWIKRNTEGAKWQVRLKRAGREETKDFDKVVICSGLTAKPVIPTFKGMEDFKGKIIHIQAFKRPSDFKDLKVLVVGMGNSAADTSTQLIGHARKIYLSHRKGATIHPRMSLGAPLDLLITRQLNVARFFLDKYAPSYGRWLLDWISENHSKKSFKLDPSWRLSPAPSLASHQPTISDTLVDSLWAGDITSVYGLRRFIAGNKVELDDGTILEVDAVVLCTGYKPDFSITPDFSPLEQGAGKEAGIKRAPLARLYQNIFPPQYADSLAYMNYAAITGGGNLIGTELMAVAIAQIWKGGFALPSEDEMNVEIDQHHKWIRSLGTNDSVYTGIVRPGPWLAFLDRAADSGVEKNLGYGWEGWKFWMRDRKLSGLMMRGVQTPFMYRLFEGRRKKWDGARNAILHSNEIAKIYRG